MRHRRLTRAELAAEVGISKPTVGESVRRLAEAGLVADTGERTVGGRGRGRGCGRVGSYYALADAGVALVLSIAPDEPFSIRCPLSLVSGRRSRHLRPTDHDISALTAIAAPCWAVRSPWWPVRSVATQPGRRAGRVGASSAAPIPDGCRLRGKDDVGWLARSVAALEWSAGGAAFLLHGRACGYWAWRDNQRRVRGRVLRAASGIRRSRDRGCGRAAGCVDPRAWLWHRPDPASACGAWAPGNRGGRLPGHACPQP